MLIDRGLPGIAIIIITVINIYYLGVITYD